MPNCTDLRLWIEEAEKLGEVRHVEGAHWLHEMGAITELASQMDPMPAVLFDKIQEYPAGYRVLTNALASVGRVALTFGNYPLNYPNPSPFPGPLDGPL